MNDIFVMNQEETAAISLAKIEFIYINNETAGKFRINAVTKKDEYTLATVASKEVAKIMLKNYMDYFFNVFRFKEVSANDLL